MREPKKLTIRMNFHPEQKNIAEDEIIYHYHWGRIIGVSVAVIIMIGSLISGRAYYFDQDNVADQQAKTLLTYTADPTSTHTIPSTSAEEIDLLLITTTEVAITAPVLTEELTEDETPATTPTISGETTEQIKQVEQIEADTALQKSHKENTTSVDQFESNVTKINSTTPATDEELTIIASVNSEIIQLPVSNNENKYSIPTAPKAKFTEPSPTIENTDLAPLFTQSGTDIFSDHVKRFIISPSVKTNEPTGTISDIIFDHNNIATVYAFSEVSNLESTTLYYIWSLNGKNVGKVRVGVGSSRWRSHSSKFIQPNMHGEWKVELQNRKGEKLAIAQFNY